MHVRRGGPQAATRPKRTSPSSESALPTVRPDSGGPPGPPPRRRSRRHETRRQPAAMAYRQPGAFADPAPDRPIKSPRSHAPGLFPHGEASCRDDPQPASPVRREGAAAASRSGPFLFNMYCTGYRLPTASPPACAYPPGPPARTIRRTAAARRRPRSSAAVLPETAPGLSRNGGNGGKMPYANAATSRCGGPPPFRLNYIASRISVFCRISLSLS